MTLSINLIVFTFHSEVSCEGGKGKNPRRSLIRHGCSPDVRDHWRTVRGDMEDIVLREGKSRGGWRECRQRLGLLGTASVVRFTRASLRDRVTTDG